MIQRESVYLFITRKKVTNITATKIWNGGTTPRPSIYFKLFRAITNNWEPVPDAETKQLDNGITSVTWEDIQQYDDSGNEYTFKVQSGDQNGNDYVPSGYQKLKNALVVTNENKEVISVSGQKHGKTMRIKTANDRDDHSESISRRSTGPTQRSK